MTSFFLILTLSIYVIRVQSFLSRGLIAKTKTTATTCFETIVASPTSTDISTLKSQIIQLGASLDRGQSYNPTSGEFYSERMSIARRKIQSLLNISDAENKSYKLTDIEGEWELMFTTVPHGIFRSSPFFLAIQEAYALGGSPEKANLFFKLHELQTCSWGASKIGKVGQIVDWRRGLLISEFDTIIFSLTVIPVLGWFKLLPTFGGTVITVSKASMADDGCTVNLEVDYTTAKPIDGLQGVPVWDVKVPVGAIWRLLPWNQSRAPICSIKIKYADEDFRVMEDRDGEFFVYSRPIQL